MPPHRSPRRRGPVRAAAALLALATAPAVLAAPAAADAPPVGEHYASAQLLVLNSIDGGYAPVGNLNTDENGAEAAADFTADPDGLSDFVTAEGEARVHRTGDALTAEASVRELTVAAPDDAAAASAPEALARAREEVSGTNAVSVSSVESAASWSAELGATVELEVGEVSAYGVELDLSGQPSDREVVVERFAEDGVTYQYDATITAERILNRLDADGGPAVGPAATTANAWLEIRLDESVIEVDGGDTVYAYTEDVQVGFVNVHSLAAVGGEPTPLPTETADPTDPAPAPSPTGTATEPAAPSPTPSAAPPPEDDAEGTGALPTTGVQLAGLIGAAVAALTGGAGAMLLARRRGGQGEAESGAGGATQD
ncbi:hypothetical protein [Allonocardiopsis opalescens]|uniref:LPXTG-motif cell wall-anchored protein n=1 Tax=Allonocardiopsis opalescens TaxID=1144618 RepID=A0A2T0QA29_9ACTN|nr:hypothetical protein [Allonocardiopsis opalescens]PRY00651.1 hypothetical protein CLV72_102282 [Allonocardiopsis opalescens]